MGIMIVDEKDKEEIFRVINSAFLIFDDVDLGYVLDFSLDEMNIAVVTSERFKPHEGMKFAMKLASFIKKNLKHKCNLSNFNVNVRVLHLSPVSFQYDAIRKGKLVFCRNPARRVMYEADVITKTLLQNTLITSKVHDYNT